VPLVDDEMDGRDAIKQMLEDAGAVVTAVNSAASAYASLKTHRPHVLVCDIGMPQEDGLTFMPACVRIATAMSDPSLRSPSQRTLGGRIAYSPPMRDSRRILPTPPERA
jgi:CheY-like chemotaxis protein